MRLTLTFVNSYSSCTGFSTGPEWFLVGLARAPALAFDRIRTRRGYLGTLTSLIHYEELTWYMQNFSILALGVFENVK